MSESSDNNGELRLCKLIGSLAKISRRDAETLIKTDGVFVNGELVKNPLILVKLTDEVRLLGVKTGINKSLEVKKLLKQSNDPVKLYALYKPRDYIVTEKDEQNRKTVYELIPKKLGRLIYVGRLDINSEGLLLFTNNGDFARYLTLPRNGFLREYKVRAFGFFDQKKIERISKGVTIEGVSYKPDYVRYDEKENGPDNWQKGSCNNWFFIGIKTGKNREVRKLFEHFGFKVNRLVRISYAGISLIKGMKAGDIYEVERTKVAKLVSSMPETERPQTERDI